MSLSISTRDLLQQAKLDAPSSAAREAMWTGIETQAAASTVAATAAEPGKVIAAKGLGVFSSKLIAGIALGASVAIGAAVAVLVTNHMSRSSDADVEVSRTREMREIGPLVVMPRLPAVIQGHAVTADPKDDDITIEATPDKAEKTDKAAPTVAAPVAAPALSESDRLAREARTVSEARGALRRGEPEAALRIVRAERRKKGARLIPEELNVEIQALRAMGDEVGARNAEAELTGKYPEQSLAH